MPELHPYSQITLAILPELVEGDTDDPVNPFAPRAETDSPIEWMEARERDSRQRAFYGRKETTMLLVIAPVTEASYDVTIFPAARPLTIGETFANELQLGAVEYWTYEF